jgi:hypothetical protein
MHKIVEITARLLLKTTTDVRSSRPQTIHSLSDRSPSIHSVPDSCHTRRRPSIFSVSDVGLSTPLTTHFKHESSDDDSPPSVRSSTKPRRPRMLYPVVPPRPSRHVFFDSCDHDLETPSTAKLPAPAVPSRQVACISSTPTKCSSPYQRRVRWTPAMDAVLLEELSSMMGTSCWADRWAALWARHNGKSGSLDSSLVALAESNAPPNRAIRDRARGLAVTFDSQRLPRPLCLEHIVTRQDTLYVSPCRWNR